MQDAQTMSLRDHPMSILTAGRLETSDTTIFIPAVPVSELTLNSQPQTGDTT